MGRVDKATSLKKICGEESGRTQYVDGVCFIKFGQDATLHKVREEMSWCIRNFGGLELVRSMSSAANFGDVVNRAA